MTINGDGQTSRDFCYVANAVQANIRAALAGDEAQGEVYNVAVGERTSLVELFALLGETLGHHQIHYGLGAGPGQDFRAGDVRHSLADIEQGAQPDGYEPTHRIHEGLEKPCPGMSISCGRLLFRRSGASTRRGRSACGLPGMLPRASATAPSSA